VTANQKTDSFLIDVLVELEHIVADLTTDDSLAKSTSPPDTDVSLAPALKETIGKQILESYTDE
jgi:hypothetical protein